MNPIHTLNIQLATTADWIAGCTFLNVLVCFRDGECDSPNIYVSFESLLAFNCLFRSKFGVLQIAYTYRSLHKTLYTHPQIRSLTRCRGEKVSMFIVDQIQLNSFWILFPVRITCKQLFYLTSQMHKQSLTICWLGHFWWKLWKLQTTKCIIVDFWSLLIYVSNILHSTTFI